MNFFSYFTYVGVYEVCILKGTLLNVCNIGKLHIFRLCLNGRMANGFTDYCSSIATVQLFAVVSQKVIADR
jgi:hypothetical protein